MRRDEDPNRADQLPRDTEEDPGSTPGEDGEVSDQEAMEPDLGSSG